MSLSKTALPFIFLFGLLSAMFAQARGTDADLVHWLTSDTAAFEKARRQNKPLLLYLEAVWCHWCHVMDQKTYADKQVARLLNEHFISLRIDQDARPDLANRYRDYGWPATIFFTPEGTDMVKRAGYIAPDNMQQLLRAIIADPDPEAAAALQLHKTTATSTVLTDTLRTLLQQRHRETYDPEVGGLKTAQKYLERDSVEYTLLMAANGDLNQAQQARQTLDAALNLLDPVWGGAYQYSTGFVWTKQHYEKLARIQAAYLRIYTLAYAQLKDPAYRKATDNIIQYLKNFLLDKNGAFYTSQDADLVAGQHSDSYFKLDDQQRRLLGVPVIDKNIYSNDNGLIIESLALVHELHGDPAALGLARQAATWILKNRQLKNHGFSHGQIKTTTTAARLYLADNLNMARGFLGLYRATAERHWLQYALDLTHTINSQFNFVSGGYASAAQGNFPVQPVPQLDENISLARFANLLYRISGQPVAAEVAEKAMLYLASEAVAGSRLTEAGILIAEQEFAAGPLHLTIIGSKSDLNAQQLFTSASNLPYWYKRVEWWDKTEGPLPNPDVTYPSPTRPAVFICTDQRCSVPIYTSEKMLEYLHAS
ncbi:MAG: DUF255 domain-containing protein [Pseudomonadales bacterium]|nr:DUF255 domain-containing protein [Pseudomonadales bacterium]